MARSVAAETPRGARPREIPDAARYAVLDATLAATTVVRPRCLAGCSQPLLGSEMRWGTCRSCSAEGRPILLLRERRVLP